VTSRAVGRTTVALDVLIAAMVLGGVALFLANRSLIDGNTAFLFGLFGATSAAYAVAGTLIVRRQRANPIGWLFFAMAFLLIAGMSATEYAIHAILIAPGSLPAPGAVLSLAEPTPGLFVTGLILLLYLFPRGSPTGPRWRVAATVTLVAGCVMAVVTVLSPHTITDIWASRMSDVGLRVRDPFGIEGLDLPHAFYVVAATTLALGAVAGVASLFARRRGADGTTREQLRWLAWVVGVSAAWIAVMLPIAAIVQSPATDALFWTVITPLLSIGVPIAVGIAILRYRLFDIDVVINRTVVFGALAAFITLVYVAVVVGVGQLVGTTGSSPALSIVATALVAVTFQPVRARVQRLANRLVYGERATPYEVLGEFSDRIGAAYSSDELLPRMARILAEGTAATEASIWLEDGGRLRRDTSWPEGHRSVVLTSVNEIQAKDADLAVPVRHGGEVLGALSIRKRPSDPVTTTERALVERLASQAGLVLRNARLIEELRASRWRIVTAQDQRAKKLERDIHDGAQQQLVALAVRQRLAASLVGRDDEQLRATLESLQAETSEALENLRDLARGIYPPLLADRGLVEALSAQARKSPVEVIVASDGIGRYQQEVESAVYFCCLEALQNVAKYANAGHVDVRLAGSDGELVFEVADDGRGFDPSVTPRGTGLQGMADRLDAIGGRLEVRSAPGEGTRVIGRVPTDGLATEGGDA
jgi:signal transduction histidine kinase